MKFRPEIALTRLQLAELLLEHYPQEESEAIAHLDFAIKDFREMKRQPSLERALRHKADPVLVIFVFLKVAFRGKSR
jgi:hypothetical protein